MEIMEMAARFEAYDKETREFIFGEWIDMTWAQRDEKQAAIDAKHSYKHGWIIVEGKAFSREEAFPNMVFLNSWD